MCGTCNWEEAIEQCDRILEACDDVPERAEDFAGSVMEKVEGIREWIDRNEHVTTPQVEALDNMEAALERWRQ